MNSVVFDVLYQKYATLSQTYFRFFGLIFIHALSGFCVGADFDLSFAFHIAFGPLPFTWFRLWCLHSAALTGWEGNISDDIQKMILPKCIKYSEAKYHNICIELLRDCVNLLSEACYNTDVSCSATNAAVNYTSFVTSLYTW